METKLFMTRNKGFLHAKYFFERDHCYQIQQDSIGPMLVIYEKLTLEDFIEDMTYGDKYHWGC